MKKIGIMLGVFNPPHNFHFMIANEILKNNAGIEKIIFVPTNDKYAKPDVVSSKHRFNMLKLICDENSKLEVSRFEIDRPNQPYSEETLKHFSSQYPNHKITLIIGSDNLKTFNTWRNYSEILKTFTPIVFERDNDNLENIINEYNFLTPYKHFIQHSNCSVSSDLSATKIRNLIKENKDFSQYLPEKIKQYIIDNNLYSSKQKEDDQ